MPFSSGKKAVIFNRADGWDFSSYREVGKEHFWAPEA
jgi:maltose-binding protein MalE